MLCFAKHRAGPAHRPREHPLEHTQPLGQNGGQHSLQAGGGNGQVGDELRLGMYGQGGARTQLLPPLLLPATKASYPQAGSNGFAGWI